MMPPDLATTQEQIRAVRDAVKTTRKLLDFSVKSSSELQTTVSTALELVAGSEAELKNSVEGGCGASQGEEGAREA